MAVSKVEVAFSTNGPSSTPSATITTTPAAGDYVLAVYSCTAANTMSSVSGMGATWGTPVGVSAAGVTHWFCLGTGATTSGAVTATMTAGKNGGMAVFLVRGVPTGATLSTPDTVTVAAGTAITGPTTSAGVDSFVLGVMGVDTNTLTWPDTQTPSGAWTAETLQAGSFHAYRVGSALPTSTTSYSTTGVAANFTNKRISQVVIAASGGTTTPVSLTGELSTLTLAAPAGTISIPTPVSLTGEVSTATLAAAAGTVDAGSPVALTGDFTVMVLGTYNGTVTITPAAGAVSLTGEVSTLTLAAPAGAVTTTSTPLGTFALNAKASLTASLPTITLVPLTVSLAAKASLSVATRAVKMLAVSLEAKADLRVTLPRHQTVDPVTGLPQYRLQVIGQDGTLYPELPRAAIGEHTTGLGLDDERLTFTLPKYDAGNRIVTARKGDPVREVQLWRGPNLEAWVKVDGDRPGDGVTEYDCSSLAGYLKGRVVGRTPKTDWLVNGDFSNGEYGWSFGFEAGSVPAAAPTHEVVDVDFFGKASKALKLGGSDVVTQIQAEVKTAAVFAPNSATYVSGGEAKIQAAGANIPNGTDVHIVGYTAYNWLDGDYGDGLTLSLNRARAARATLAAMGKGFTFSIDPALPTPNVKDTSLGVAGRGRYGALNGNNTYAEQEQNRRVVFSYAGTITFDADAAQYAQGSLVVGTVTVPVSEKRGLPIAFRGWAWLDSIVKKSRAGYGVYIQIAKASAPDVIVEEAHSTLDETSPVQVWERHRAEVTVPPDGLTYIYTARLYAPKGAVLWTSAGVYPAEALHFPGVDRALIVKGLVEHAQDPAMGKLGDTPILIGTRTPLTGKTLTRTYPFYERRQILDAVQEHTAVHDGVDLSMDHNTREIVTHFPWRGQRSGVTFELGSNISAYEAPTSVTDAKTRAITQGLESSGADREEGIVTDLTGLGGVLIEGLNYAEPETPVTELEASSRSAIVRNGHPVTDLTVTIGRVGAWDPALTSWMLDHVGVGDIVDVVIIDGTVNIVGPHRVIRRTLTPDTDTLRYALAPEPEEA